MKRIYVTILLMVSFVYSNAQEGPALIKKYPKEIFDVLNNPGIGFMTFQRRSYQQESSPDNHSLFQGLLGIYGD